MRVRCFVGVVVTGLLVVGIFASDARAQFYNSLFRGLSRLSAPAAPSALRFGQFRISQEPFSDGWRFDFSRSFGPDSFGRPNRIDLGPFDYTFNSGQVSWSGQFSKRVIPSVEFNAATNAPIDYSMSLNTGFQDVNIDNAQLAYNMGWNINALGFYDYVLNVSHRGEFDIDGMLLVDHGTLDFDIGPINMSGNIVGDMLAAVTAPLFAAGGTDNPFAVFSGRATKRIEVQKTIDTLTGRAKAGEMLSAEEVDELLQATVIAAALDGNAPDFSYLGDEEFAAILEAVGAELVSADEEDSPGAGLPGDGGLLAPEPATALLLILGAGVLLAIRRRRAVS
jgi:hypothetical protein